MNTKTFESLISWFNGFAAGYADAGGLLHPMLQLKLDHSRRVAEDCRAIAGELGWPGDGRRTAEIIGLLHDAGRFPQYTQYRTFFDPSSLNHGECGYETVLHSEAMKLCDPHDAAIILDSIRYHNRRQIPATVAAESLPFIKLIRDTDKLDILLVVNDTIRNNRHKDFPEILLNIDIEGPPNPDLVREIRDTRSGTYEGVKTLADMNLMRLSWVYDMNYAPTFRRLVERRLMEDMFGSLPDTPDIRAIIAGVKQHIEENLAGNRAS